MSRLSRRSLLRALGAASLAPLLPALDARAQTSAPPRRLILFFTPHGAITDAWLPTGTETQFSLGPVLRPLARHQSKLVVLGGMKMPGEDPVGAPHTKGLPLLWTGSRLQTGGTFQRTDGVGGFTYGWNSGPSVDQVVAASLQNGRPYPSLELGVQCYRQEPSARMIYRAPSFPLDPGTDPQAVFNTLFSSQQVEPAALTRARAERRSVIDLVKGELESLNRDLGVVDRHKIDAHLTAMRELERSLAPPTSACFAPALGAGVGSGLVANRPVLVDQQLSLLAQAVACDLSRVLSFQYSSADNDAYPYPWLGIDANHHLLSHEESEAVARAKRIQITTWFSEKFALLLDKLAAIPEGGGTALDNTMVVWGSELGNAQNHSFDDVPFIVAGGGAAGVRTGRFLQTNGALHNRLLVSMCHFMGLTNVQTFGNLDRGQGPLPGLLS